MTNRPPAPRRPLAPGLSLLRRPAPRATLAALAVALLLVVAATPPVSAETYLDEEIVEYQDMGSTFSKPYGSSMGGGDTYKYFRFSDISQYTNLAYIIFDHTLEGPVTYPPFPEGRSETTYTINGKTKPAVVYYELRHNILGQPTGWRLTIFPQNWDVTGEFGDRAMSIGNWVMQTGYWGSTSIPAGTPFWFGTQNSRYTTVYQYKTTVAANKEWRNRITVTDFDSQTYKVEIFRDFGAVSYASTLNLINDGNIEFSDVDSHNFSTYQPMRLLDTVQLISGSSIYNRSIINPESPNTPSTVPVNIVALDSRTGNLLLDAAVEVRDQNGTVVATGSTSPNGWLVFEYDLPATLTDEDFQRYYSVNITLPGWAQKTPGLQFYPAFIPRSGDWIRVEMLPDSSGPADPGKTYLMFYVRDTSGNGLPGAYVNIDGEYWGTNNAGHVAVAVAKNATYPYTVSKSGYMTISGSATVGDAPSYIVNVVLGAGSVPTYTPTAGPGGPGTTPTPDHRTNEQKGQAVIDMIADNAEGIGALALICLIMGLLKLLAKW